MMAIEGKQTSDANPLPYNLLQHDPAKGLAGLAEGLEPTSATDEELDDYEQVLFDEIQHYMLGRSMLTHQCQAPALLESCAGACDCSMYMSYLTMPQTCRLQAYRVTKYRESALGASKGILEDTLCLPVRLPQNAAGVWQRGFPRHPPAAAEAFRQCVKGADAGTAGAHATFLLIHYCILVAEH